MNVRLRRDFNFTAGIYYSDTVQMNNYNLRLWLITNSYSAENHNIALERIKYFLYNVIDSSVFVNQSDVESCQRLISANVRVTTLPSDPVDQMVGIMLFNKLNSIMEGQMIVVENELSSVLGDGMTYLHSEEETSSDFQQPEWWATNDLTHYDTEIVSTDNVVAIHQIKTWRDLNLSWVSESTDSDDNTVVFADFKRDETK